MLLNERQQGSGHIWRCKGHISIFRSTANELEVVWTTWQHMSRGSVYTPNTDLCIPIMGIPTLTRGSFERLKDASGLAQVTYIPHTMTECKPSRVSTKTDPPDKPLGDLCLTSREKVRREEINKIRHVACGARYEKPIAGVSQSYHRLDCKEQAYSALRTYRLCSDSPKRSPAILPIHYTMTDVKEQEQVIALNLNDPA